MRTQSKALPRAGFFAAAFVAALAFTVPGAAQQQAPAPAAPAVATPDLSLGDPRAPVTIIEYASMSCPHCAEFHNVTLPRLKTEYIDTGKARLIFREYPLNQPAVYGAILARCSGPQRFFPFIEAMFKQQAAWAVASDPVGRLTQIAQIGGVTQEQFQACLNDRNLTNAIIQTRLEGEQRFGVQSTPTFVLNNQYVLEGALPYERFQQAIEDVLAGRPARSARGVSSSSESASDGGNTTTYVVIGVVVVLIAAVGFFFMRRPKAA